MSAVDAVDGILGVFHCFLLLQDFCLTLVHVYCSLSFGFYFPVFSFQCLLMGFSHPIEFIEVFLGQFTDFISLGSVPGSLAFIGD